jgi:RimJ/RimL family protein N-acetyltransferase
MRPDMPAPSTTLVSDSVVGLRRPEPIDGPLFLRIRNDLAVVSMMMGFRLGVSEQTVSDWIKRGGDVSGDDLLLTAVVIPEAHRPIGYIKAYHVDRYSRHAWLGLSLFDQHDAGRGYGRRILTLMSDYLRDYVDVRKISLELLATNERALGLYTSLGFEPEGRMKSQYFTGGRYEDVLILSRFLQPS